MAWLRCAVTNYVMIWNDVFHILSHGQTDGSTKCKCGVTWCVSYDIHDQKWVFASAALNGCFCIDSVRYELKFYLCEWVSNLEGFRIWHVLWKRSLWSMKVFTKRIFLDIQNSHRISYQVFTQFFFKWWFCYRGFTLHSRGLFWHLRKMYFLHLQDDRIWFRWMLKQWGEGLCQLYRNVGENFGWSGVWNCQHPLVLYKLYPLFHLP